MDSKQDSKQSNFDKALAKTPSSRFSRRRFIQTAACTSPILLSLKSPVAWGETVGMGQGSRAMTSLQSSDLQNAVVTPRTRSYWRDTFMGDNEIVENELALRNCRPTDSLFTVLELDQLESWTSNDPDCPEWEYKLTGSFRPNLNEALHTTKNSFKVKCRLIGTRNSTTINISRQIQQFYPNLVCSLLNSLFHPVPIDYFWVDDVKALFHEALASAINSILKDKALELNGASGHLFNNKDTKYSIALTNLVDKLNKWD